MTQDLLEYSKLVERAMRGVVRDALLLAAENGLPGLHHFYITFRTRDPDVGIADSLLAQHPEEMTIVLEHQFWNLEVEDDQFSVALSFGGMQQTLVVPFSAVTSFVDPSVKFGLQFDGADGDAANLSLATTNTSHGQVPSSEQNTQRLDDDEPGMATGDAEIVALDSFRKK